MASGVTKSEKERADRLAAALRANLKKRKAQQSARQPYDGNHEGADNHEGAGNAGVSGKLTERACDNGHEPDAKPSQSSPVAATKDAQ